MFPMEGIPIPIPNTKFPPGIRFHPSDQELISFYLERKVKSLPLPADVITDIDLYTYDPWNLPRKTMFGEEEWYFFTPRDRKYPNGGRPNRTAASGYWKATGTDQPIRSSFGSRILGVKKALVFYKGRPPTGTRMDWIMTEYRLPVTSRPSRFTGSMRLDDWVLCRIRQKGNMSKNEVSDELCSSETRWRNLPPAKESPDMLSDYLQSNEYKLIVSLLTGHDPSTFFQSSSVSESSPSSMIMNEQRGFAFQSGPLEATADARSYGQQASDGNKCKPRYPSNACISLQDLDMLPALQDNFLQ